MDGISIIKRREGKDLTVTMAISTDNELKSLVGRDLKLMVSMPLGHKSIPFEIIDDYKIRFHFREMHSGIYQFSVFENWDKERGATAVDAVRVIELVPKTYMEGGTVPEGLDVESVDLGQLNMSVSGNGSIMPLTKESVEKVLVGDITSHNHKTEIEEALKGYVPIEEGKGLSTNDFTLEYKRKVDNLSAFDASVEDANKAAAAATEAAQRANDMVNTMPHVEIVETINE